MYIPVNGVQLHYVVEGCGVPCMIPAMMGSPFYQRTFSLRLRESLQCVFVEPRGGGRSTGEIASITFETIASDMDALRQALGMQRMLVLGQSANGLMALAYAHAYFSNGVPITLITKSKLSSMTVCLSGWLVCEERMSERPESQITAPLTWKKRNRLHYARNIKMLLCRQGKQRSGTYSLQVYFDSRAIGHLSVTFGRKHAQHRPHESGFNAEVLECRKLSDDWPDLPPGQSATQRAVACRAY